MIKQQHYLEGYEAYEQLGRKANNPYSAGTQEDELWREGYMDALKADLQKRRVVA